MPRELLHVRPDADRWVVLHNGDIRASLGTRTRAVIMAREWAKALRATLTVADEAGHIVERRTYGREPRDGKG